MTLIAVLRHCPCRASDLYSWFRGAKHHETVRNDHSGDDLGNFGWSGAGPRTEHDNPDLSLHRRHQFHRWLFPLRQARVSADRWRGSHASQAAIVLRDALCRCWRDIAASQVRSRHSQARQKTGHHLQSRTAAAITKGPKRLSFRPFFSSWSGLQPEFFCAGFASARTRLGLSLGLADGFLVIPAAAAHDLVDARRLRHGFGLAMAAAAESRAAPGRELIDPGGPLTQICTHRSSP